jgi:low temperature requirement protein LtrA
MIMRPSRRDNTHRRGVVQGSSVAAQYGSVMTDAADMGHGDDDFEVSRHATNLELFLDLTFVFSVTQLTTYVADDPTVAGVAKGLLLAWLVWWQWTAFTWAGTAVDFQSNATARIVVLCMIPATLVMAISAPQALTTQGIWFAGAYFVVQLFVLALQSIEARKTKPTRDAFYRYAPLAAIAPATLLVGSFFDGDVRLAIWIGVAVIDVASALIAAGGDEQEWTIDPVHFAERHALFVIICLGEVLVAIGAKAASISAKDGLDGRSLGAIVVTVAVACLLWWSYFAFVPRVIEHQLANAPKSERGVVARDLCSFGHFPIVFGIILFAIVAKHHIGHPTGELEVADRWLLIGGAVLFIGGMLHLQWRAVRRLAPERLIAIAAIGSISAAGNVIPAALALSLVVFTIGVMSTVTWRRFRSSEIAHAMGHA